MKDVRPSVRGRWQGAGGFALLETLIAAVVFTGVFLVIVALQSQVMTTMSGSDAFRVAQLADQTLAEFLDGGKTPAADTSVVVGEIKYRQLCRAETDGSLTKLSLAYVREITGDTIATFYTERFAPTPERP